MKKEDWKAWLRIMRLQFYPMTFIAYTLGAAMAAARGADFNLGLYTLGYGSLFLLEFCTILANELYDLPSDRINQNASPFNGGSRVLVEGGLQVHQVKRAIRGLLMSFVGLGLLLVFSCHAPTRIWVAFLLVAGLFMGMGYTVPPLKFCHRASGEFVVGLTHSPYVILFGFVLQGGLLSDPNPWLVSAPLFFAVLAAITLSGIPDHAADEAAGKKTLSVFLGQRNACLLAITFAVLAVLTVTRAYRVDLLVNSGRWLMVLAIPHCMWLVIAIIGLLRSRNFNKRINGIMQLALSYIVWFGIIPLVACFKA